MNSPPRPHSTTHVVASNSFWYGLDIAVSALLLFATSIPMARVLGPDRLGYFQYIMLLTTVSGAVGSLGVPGAAGKFMAEYLGRGEPGIVRAIFGAAFRLQAIFATVITAMALVCLFAFGDPAHRVESSLQILSVLPMMIGQIATQANLANESMRDNVPSSIVSNILFAVATIVSLMLGWNLIGIAAGLLLARVVEFTMRTRTTLRWIRLLPYQPLDHDLKIRMRTFALQQTYVMVLSLVIWNKSDVVFLKLLDPDIRQVAFFTVAFNLVERAVQLPEVFAAAMSTSLVAQQGRDSTGLPGMAADAARYMFLMCMPVLFGLFLISGPLMLLMYKQRYAAAIPVLAIAALLAIVKPLVLPIDAVFRATGRQTQMLIWSSICGAINILADWLLIPHLGATGAALANGMAQGILVIGYWTIGTLWFGTKLDWPALARIAVSALAMALPIVAINRIFPPYAAVPAGVLSGAVVFFAMLRLTRALTPVDSYRLRRLGEMSPRAFKPTFDRLLQFMIPGGTIPAALSGADL